MRAAVQMRVDGKQKMWVERITMWKRKHMNHLPIWASFYCVRKESFAFQSQVHERILCNCASQCVHKMRYTIASLALSPSLSVLSLSIRRATHRIFGCRRACCICVSRKRFFIFKKKTQKTNKVPVSRVKRKISVLLFFFFVNNAIVDRPSTESSHRRERYVMAFFSFHFFLFVTSHENTARRIKKNISRLSFLPDIERWRRKNNLESVQSETFFFSFYAN